MEKSQHISTKLFACEFTETEKQAGHQSAHRLLHRVLAKEFGIFSPELRFYDHGKPFLANTQTIHFNLSHCNGLAVCAVGGAPLGVDAEEIRPFRQNVMRRAFSPAETDAVLKSDAPDEMFFRLWTLKESFVKAIGIGISYPLSTVCFTLCGNSVASNQTGWQFGQFLLRDRWIISCCVPAEDALPQNVIMI